MLGAGLLLLRDARAPHSASVKPPAMAGAEPPAVPPAGPSSAGPQTARAAAPPPAIASGMPAPAVPAVGRNATVPPSVRPPPPANLAAAGERARLAARLRDSERRERDAAWTRAAKEGWSPAGTTNGAPYELIAIRGGRVYVRTTFNREAAISTAAAAVRQTPPYDATGTGVVVGVWDAGAIRATHREFAGGRLTIADGAAMHYHSTHVGGTVGAAGIMVNAKGMAPAVTIESYDWDYDTAEMAERGMASGEETNRVQISNHSYGYQAGWSGLTWYGTWGSRESDGFGLYDTYCVAMDTLCYAAPYLLPFKAAGNDRADTPPPPGVSFAYYDGTWQTKLYDPATDPWSDDWDAGGFDTISYDGNAKNIMAVGAVNDAASNGVRSLGRATMSYFSSWGPSDDGRVKPDIVANGTSLYSTYSGSDLDYRYSSGTSMATPNAAGSAALLVEYYGRLFPNRAMRASTLKGLILHTADDLGNAGPDYQFGWGLMNTSAAAELIRRHHSRTNAQRLVEDVVSNARRTNTCSFLWDNATPIRVTLCWTDPPGLEQTQLDRRASMLVHDLDLRVLDPAGGAHFPYVLNVTNPAAPAQTGENHVDNVEQVSIPAPPAPGRYQVVVSVYGDLTAPEQVYSLLISGSGAAPEIVHEPLPNTTNTVEAYRVDVRVTCETPLNTNRLSVLWNTTGSRRSFAESLLTSLGGDDYRATLPARPGGARFYYFVRAEAANGLTSVLPATAPDDLLSFAVVSPLPLTVTGQPAELVGVNPPYGTTLYPSGVTVNAAADLYGEPTNGARALCVGWTGAGSVPSSGQTNQVSFVLNEPSLLAWQWDQAYEFRQTSTVPGLIATAAWWRAGSTAMTAPAPTQAQLDGTNYAFCGWYVNGRRLPDDTSVAANPAGDIGMDGPLTAAAVYLPAALDANADGFPDWWELFYFGSTNVARDWDGDGDGFSNIMEYRDLANPRDADSVPLPPSIAHTPLAGVQGWPAPWNVAAVVTDNDAVNGVRVEWNRNGTGWTGVAMNAAAGPAQYTNAIPAPGVTGDHFDYRIVATDRAGFRGLNGPYGVDVRYPVGTVSPANLGLFQLPSGVGLRSGMSVSNGGHATLEWTLQAQNCGLQEDVEAGTNGWTHGGTNDVWHVSSRRPLSGLQSWYFGREAQAIYPDSSKAWLASPSVVLASNSIFTYWQWLATEELKDETHAWDGGIVEISTNDGATYAQIAPVDGYPYVIFGHPASAFSDNTPCFAGTGGWQQVTFDLAAYGGQAVRLRFTFGSDGYVVNEGWHLDNLEILPAGGTAPWMWTSMSTGVTESLRVQNLFVTLDATAIPPAATRPGVLRFQCNDPLTPQRFIPVWLHNLSREILVSWTGRGTVDPSNRVLVTSGNSADFAVQASNYCFIAGIFTNGIAAGDPPLVSATNFTWHNITNSGSLHVAFLPSLAANGVPIYWLAEHGLTNGSFDEAARTDADSDGMPSWEEYVAGTDPTDAVSRLAITGFSSWGPVAVTDIWTDELSGEICTQRFVPVDRAVLSWPSVSSRWYSLSASTGMCSGFQTAADGLAATPPENTYTTPPSPDQPRFYRLGVQRHE